MLIPIAATAGAAALGAWAYGTYEPNSSLFGRAVGRGPTRERVAYLSFDDGPNPGATEPMLETLAASDVPAAFFLVGEHVRRFPEVARRVAAAGHEVGNHTLRHQKLHFRGPRRIREELERDRKSTRLNSSHTVISYAVFCLKKKTNAMPEVPCPMQQRFRLHAACQDP